jgi:hypothetical protein
MTKPVYSIDAPDKARLKIARIEIEAVLKKHDLAGVVVLHTPGMAEWFYDVRPSYSCLHVDEAAGTARVRSQLADYGGDRQAQLLDQACTANMVAALSGELVRGAGMFSYLGQVVDRATRAEHAPATFTPDPMEARKQ